MFLYFGDFVSNRSSIYILKEYAHYVYIHVGLGVPYHYFLHMTL